MPSERFMRHHYGAANWLDPKVQARLKAIIERLSAIDDYLDEFTECVIHELELGKMLIERRDLRKEFKELL